MLLYLINNVSWFGFIINVIYQSLTVCTFISFKASRNSSQWPLFNNLQDAFSYISEIMISYDIWGFLTQYSRNKSDIVHSYWKGEMVTWVKERTSVKPFILYSDAVHLWFVQKCYFYQKVAKVRYFQIQACLLLMLNNSQNNSKDMSIQQ